MKKISIVTISYNQASFLEKAINSVISQEGVALDYIIVDPGSTDGSRNIIDRYRDYFSHVYYGKDRGPADGLNIGFAFASGDIYGYLNSDDAFEPGALRTVSNFFDANPAVDVVSGHAWIVDDKDRRLRRVWSEQFSWLPVAYGEAVQIQPSTYITADAFRRTAGFNINNKSNWDGELMVDLYNAGARFSLIDAFLSQYRLHETSITNSGSHDLFIKNWGRRRFEKMMGRKFGPADHIARVALKISKHISHPRAAIERMRYGGIYGRGTK